jgi:multidrug efflux pump subunit AcrB
VVAGLENSLYIQIGLVPLIGRSAKHATLIVEFARNRRAAGVAVLLPDEDTAVASASDAPHRLRRLSELSLAAVSFKGHRWPTAPDSG